MENPSDEVILAQLDRSRVAEWSLLGDLLRNWHAVDVEDVEWRGSEELSKGVMSAPYVVYSDRVDEVVRLLDVVGAVTPVYDWSHTERPEPNKAGAFTAADAVRLATALVRGERFFDGVIGGAVEDGTLLAVLAALVAWFEHGAAA